MTGPLHGLRILEIGAIGPAPFAAMLLADLGADVVRVDRPGDVAGQDAGGRPTDLLNRGKRSIAVDLKHPRGAATVLRLAAGSDALLEGFRPGVLERLGLGPEQCMAANPGLAYGRMTGWGQDGPLAAAAGHDINYIAVTGVLDAIGTADGPPVVPLNLLGDFGGGGVFLAFGVLAAVWRAQRSGHGQVVDTAIVDGVAVLSTMVHALRADGRWVDRRAANPLDGGAPHYGVYRCADDRYVSIGPIEDRFYVELLDRMGVGPDDVLRQPRDRAAWPAQRARMAQLVASRPSAEWVAVLGGTDACFAPVVSLAEAPHHPQLRARGTFAEIGGVVQPAPAPRFSGTPSGLPQPPPAPGQHGAEILREAGFGAAEIGDLIRTGAVRLPGESQGARLGAF
ncbi:CaiB/BaiF CoA-transferase family protein [Dactylosporangium sp. AC04546]|uniref:CaiB/BaiF CoA transferase family protein n=1 Tax=Dactylosporangium sp. AC04546 TaxID=2862460 RepID=UPI001EE0D959|nr:CaiB/BaiF CoA-transferase family protein [Dactylosporangium sp. AC04546]WVK88989.1 CaiB/BaiF CoA-transferase family protein [Dactylosporangium sp. AC04546]